MPGQEAHDGLSKVAHAIRRSAALGAAVQLTPPDGTVEDVLDLAGRLATWLAGEAGAREAEDRGGEKVLGLPFPPP